MAKHGIKGIIGGGAAPGGAQQSVVEAWQKIEAEHGRETELGGNLIISFSVYLAESTDQGIREARSFFEENMKMFAPLGFVRGLTDDQIEALGDPDRAYTANLPTLEQGVEGGSWLIGTPEQVTEQLMTSRSSTLVWRKSMSECRSARPQSVIIEQLEQFAEDVMRPSRIRLGNPLLPPVVVSGHRKPSVPRKADGFAYAAATWSVTLVEVSIVMKTPCQKRVRDPATPAGSQDAGQLLPIVNPFRLHQSPARPCPRHRQKSHTDWHHCP